MIHRNRGILILLSAPMVCLWAIILLVGGRPAVLSWWLIQAFGITGIIFLTISVMRIIRRRGPEIFSILTMVLSIIAIWPLLWFLGIGSIAFPADIKKTETAVSVRSPFTERVLTGWGGDSLETNYHVVVPVERWAYDIIKLPASVGSSNLNDYGIYGLEIVSPVSGTVVQMRNDLPDHPPGDFPVKFRDMKGNFIYLKLDQSGTYLLLAHFMKDSIVVEEGEHVSEGDFLGRVGNSGNSSEPHLHIHHQKDNPLTNSFLTARGLPLYFRQELGPRMPICGEEIYPYIDENDEVNR